MAALTRFDPFDDAFPELFKGLARMPRLWRDNAMEIKLDVTEADKQYKVRAEIPGAKKEDIRVRVDGNTVTIGAEIKKEAEEKGEHFVRQERYVGAVSRSFTLGSAVDEKAASARYADGVLELTLPKKSNEAGKQLTIQ